MIPNWEKRQANLYKVLNSLLMDEEIKVICFQEVNDNNIYLIEQICKENDFICLKKFPMKTETIDQYNIIAISNDIKDYSIYCLPHGNDNEYKNINEQIINYGMSDYRTTVSSFLLISFILLT